MGRALQPAEMQPSYMLMSHAVVEGQSRGVGAGIGQLWVPGLAACTRPNTRKEGRGLGFTVPNCSKCRAAHFGGLRFIFNL